MKRLFRFTLRTTFAFVTVVAVLCALLVIYSTNRSAQKRNVEKLLELGGQSYSRQGSSNKIQVWYGGDLGWNDAEGRFEITVASCFGERTGINGWIYDNFGLDFVDTPIALEIDCHGLDSEISTPNQEIINQIKMLPTVRQVWIQEWMDGDGNCNNEKANNDLRQMFPSLIVASPQQNRGITNKGLAPSQ